MAYTNNTRNTRNTAPARAQSAAPAPRWTNITGEMVVFGNARETKTGKPFTVYATSISRKNEAGNWDNCYMDVVFAKDVNPDIIGKFAIHVSDGFLSVRVWDDKAGHHVEPCVVVRAFDIIE